MFSGRFGNTTGRPYVEALINLPRLGITGGVSFLVDTGGDQTVLAPTDAIRMGIQYSKFAPSASRVLRGVGRCRGFKERAYAIFLDDSRSRLVGYEIELLIAETKLGLRCPSLLGRDVLRYFRFRYNFPRSLVFTVISAHESARSDKPHTRKFKAKIKQLGKLPD